MGVVKLLEAIKNFFILLRHTYPEFIALGIFLWVIHHYKKKKKESEEEKVAKEVEVIPQKPKKRPDSVFASDVKRQIASQTGFKIYWPEDSGRHLDQRRDFTAFIDNPIERIPFVVKMDKMGVDKIILRDGKEILFNQTKVKNKKKKEPQKKAAPEIPAKKIGQTNVADLPEGMMMTPEGELRMKPNFKALAVNWVNDNINLINYLFSEEVQEENGQSFVKIGSDKLPSDKEVWGEICSVLEKEDGTNTSLVGDGIIIRM